MSSIANRNIKRTTVMYSIINLIFSTVFLAIFICPVAADVTKADIEKALDTHSLSHPYLYFSEEDKPRLFDRITNDEDCAGIMNRLIAEANRLLHTPVDFTLPVKPDNPAFENSWAIENFMLTGADRAFNLAFVYQVTGDERYAQKAFEFADVVCDQPTWVHDYHEFPIFYTRVWPWGAQDDQVVFSYAQWSDHIVFRVAAVYDWLYTAINKRQRDRIRGALLEKAITRVRGNYEYHWWSSAYRCNWCAVCNASLGVAAIALLTEDPQLTDVVAESWNRISHTLDEINDGGWNEGMSYLDYTLRSSLMFADVMKRVTDSTYNMYRHPSIDNAVKSYLYAFIPPNKTLHFGDCSGGGIGSYNTYTKLINETGSSEASWLRQHYSVEKPTGLYDLLVTENSLEPSVPDEASVYFEGIGWTVMRSDFSDTEKVIVATKAGLNNDPHHGHLDAGHFSLYWRGTEFISDNGSAPQDQAYFQEARWDNPFASSVGHNVVFVNGEKQLPCKLKDTPWDETIGGKICEFRAGKDRDYTIMDATKAYPCKELKSWRRHVILDKPVITVVLDEVLCDPGAEIE
ncbi:heparinase II/III family protein, partial [Candidatus Latescibacterota bacterium]